MSRINSLPRLPQDFLEQEILDEYRLKALKRFGFGFSPFLLPFLLLELSVGRYFLATLLLFISASSLINSIAIDRKQHPPIPQGLLFLVVNLAVITGMFQIGLPAGYWSFPVPLAFQFVCRRRVARVIGWIFLITVLPVAAWNFPLEHFLRFSVTLIMVCLFTHLMVRVILDLQQKLVLQTLIDPLTGIQNRRGFTAALEQLINHEKVADNAPLLMLLDVDFFKQINDQHGHDVGDNVLQAMVDLFRNIVLPDGQMFRLGGEEFAFLFAQIHPQDAYHLAEQIRQEVEQMTPVEEGGVTVSLGLAARQQGESSAEWFKRTDILLYAAKQQGRNRVVTENQNLTESIDSL